MSDGRIQPFGAGVPTSCRGGNQSFRHTKDSKANDWLRNAGDATRRSQTLAITHAIATTVDGLGTVAETLAAAVDAVFEHSGYHEVAATVIDRGAGEQLTVADRSHSLRNRTGMRRPVDDGDIGAVATHGRQVVLGPGAETKDEPPRNSARRKPEA